MTNNDPVPECYPATVRIPGPIPVRDDRDLIDIVGRLCGDELRDLLRERLEGGPFPADLEGLRRLIDQINSAVSCMEDDLSAIGRNLDQIQENFL